MLYTFVGGDDGEWAVEQVDAVRGDSLPSVARVAVGEGRDERRASSSAWILRGVTSNERYVRRDEQQALLERSPALGRVEATAAALIPIRKTAAWWALAQDERRAIFEERSRHVATGLEYLPAVARRLHHSRDLGERFDFLTWFEFAPADSAAFDQLVSRLRGTEEWSFVEREVDIRMSRVRT